jgi:RHS repeat-associated protein
MKIFYLKAFILLFSITIYCQDNKGVETNDLPSILKNENLLNPQEKLKKAISVDNKVESTVPTGTSSEVGITSGQLSVSLSGAANYSIPIATPPGINGVVPQIALNYSSQAGNGLAGYLWNISGVSSISRIASTKFHDNVIDGVDFDNLDRFALDGQRLIVKNGTSGTYGLNGTIYETENFSNLKVTSVGVSPFGANYGPEYFKVEYPDGSVAVYGNNSNSRSITSWTITYMQNPQGVRISYEYNNSNNNITIAKIKYGSVGANPAINEIQFVYKARQRAEQGYVGGQSMLNNTILSEIKIIANGVGFKNYVLTNNLTSLGYERLVSITEKNGDNSKSLNPTVFTYEDTSEVISYNPATASLPLNNVSSQNSFVVSGDFNGDSKMDFIVASRGNSVCKLFDGISTNSNNVGVDINTGSYYEQIFASSSLLGNDSSGYSMLPMQSFTFVNNSGSTFKTYANGAALGTGTPITLLSEVNVTYPLYDSSYCAVDSASVSCTLTAGWSPSSKKIVSGDFNGDGLTDVMAIEYGGVGYSYDCTSYYDEYGSLNCQSQGGYFIPKAVYFVNLDKRVGSNNLLLVGNLISGIVGYSKIEVVDFNGDGKSDFMIIENSKVSIYTLNNTNDALVLLYSNLDGDIVATREFLIGDYNGDGKTDFMFQTGDVTSDNFIKYTSNGNAFVKEYVVYVFPHIGTVGGAISYLIPNDLNNDGKTDLIYVNTFKGTGGYIKIKFYKNMGNSFVPSIQAETGLSNDILAYPIPIFISSDKPNRNLELSFISNNKIHQFQSQKDFNRDKLVRSIKTGLGVTETITYKPLVYEPCPYNCNSVYYGTNFIEKFPNVDVNIAPSFQVVSKLEKQSASVYKKQLFSYSGAVSNFEGLGFVGFRSTMRTNWHDDTNQIISNVSRNSINLRGVSIEDFSVLNLYTPNNSLSPDNFISKSITKYNTYDDITFEPALLPNKVFKLKSTINQQFNGLESTSTETITKYDLFNNPTNVIINTKQNTAIVQKAETNIFYDPEMVSPYVIGRPNKRNNVVTFYPNQATQETTGSEELYTYNSSLLLSQLKKKGNATNYVTEDNIYDSFGNITKKTITAVGLSARNSSYQYDTSGRFLIKSTDIEGLTSSYDYNNSSGVLNFELNPYGLKTSYIYDIWYRKIKTTDYLGKNNFYDYTKNNSVNTSLYTHGDDGSESFEIFDDLGRKTLSKVKTISSWSNIDYYYDIYDRNYKTSEPYDIATASKWEETKYDVYGRVTQNIGITGKTTNISYNGLTSTLNDGVTNVITTKNALGYVISSTDNGGTINYSHDANGKVKISKFDNTTITIEYDGWGRKVKLTDPAAGSYIYKYNDLGEILSEESPKGVTSYKLDQVGKIASKTIIGDLTNSETNYFYNATTKLLESFIYNDNLEGSATTYTNTYDSYNRIIKTVESNPSMASFEHRLTYDLYGRTEKELYSSVEYTTGKVSSKWIKNTYKNGAHWQILEDATQKVLWQTNTVNARGQLTGALLGNGINITNTYDQYGLVSQIKHEIAGTTPVNVMTLGYIFNAQRGLLNSRSNSIFAWNENFKYDNLERLTSYTNSQGIDETQDYDNKGRITVNNLGKYKYNPSLAYQNSSIEVTAEALSYYQGAQLQTITYNAFKSPVVITLNKVDKINFVYNTYNDRSAMYYGDESKDKLLRPNRKYYSADGSLEIKHNRLTNVVEFLTYIGGDGYSAPVVLKSDGTTEQYLYLHRDNQGTILAVSDATGLVLEKRLFDAWGNIVKVQDKRGKTLLGLSILDRGYTGHEHLQSVGLIHMNGRLYDPKLHRFLQPDNFVQDPSNTQSYNRYGYCWNNPLAHTDISGEYFGWDDLVVAGVGGLFNWGVNGFKLNGEGLGYFAVGMASGIATYYGGPLAGAAVLGAGNSITGQVAANGWNNIDYGQVIGNTAMSVATAYVGGQITQGLSPYLDKTVSSITNSTILQSALKQSAGNAISGFALSASYSAMNGGDTSQVFSDGFRGAAQGFAMGFANGLVVGYVQQKTVFRQEQATKTQTDATNQSNTAVFDNPKTPGVSNHQFEDNSVNFGGKPSDVLNYHGNDLRSTKPTWGYKLYSADGTFLKNGITNKVNPEARYSKAFMADKKMIPFKQFPNRLDAWNWEFQQNTILRGPLNLNMH